jgi:Mo-dependent nitrogenase C-terminus
MRSTAFLVVLSIVFWQISKFKADQFKAEVYKSLDFLSGIWFYLLHRTFNDPKLARWVCRRLPTQCPFERTVSFLSLEWHIPALCKLNPFYGQLMTLRFKALSYLAEDCGEDVIAYCQ